METEIKINGVAIVFQFSIFINTITTEKPTEFTMNYLKTLADMAGKHLSKQIGESMIDRVREDFNQYPKEELWGFKKEAK